MALKTGRWSQSIQEPFRYPSPILCLALTPLNTISDGSNNALPTSPVTSGDDPDLPTEPRPLACLFGTASSPVGLDCPNAISSARPGSSTVAISVILTTYNNNNNNNIPRSIGFDINDHQPDITIHGIARASFP
ncbi:hypothetical protein FA13DRAFT_975796 [Coprinellus micaceus]|uniref:Uncharacterized protein n=1 Tax=Coprinellus micaceus TaxID=71717 RepID=A0A4Y7SZM0_COPMI|nr:hypothetical protein FA13DRAFT_975796 [Coprinellus micaceus]